MPLLPQASISRLIQLPCNEHEEFIDELLCAVICLSAEQGAHQSTTCAPHRIAEACVA